MDLVGWASAQTHSGLGLGVLVTVFVAGFRHGFDIDHIAAIGDITTSQRSSKSAILLSTCYVVGHILVVVSLGVAAMLLGRTIPPSFDAVAGRMIGLTLVLLGLYVFYSLVRHRHDFRMRSRWMLLIAGARRGLAWMRPTPRVVVEHEHDHAADGHHEHRHQPRDEGSTPSLEVARDRSLATRVTSTHSHVHRHVVKMPPDPFTEYTTRTSFVIGMIHGVGAETPTQILLFTAAAGVAGAMGAVVLVAAFALALLLGNTVLVIALTAGHLSGRRMPLFYVGLAATTAALSIYIGGAHLLDRPDVLPGFFGS